MILGRVMTNPGKYVIRNRIAVSARINGIRVLITLDIGTFATEQAVKRQTPTGGVISPTLKATTITTPKCMGDIPILTIIGSRMGTRMG
jgi:hypothetical protein